MASVLRTHLLSQLSSISGLDAVEELVAQKFESDLPLMTEIPNYLFGLGGKRIRPVLSLLMWKTVAGTAPSQEVIDIAAGIELIHMATLLHDDIIDRSPMRRHKPSPFQRYGLGDTLITGDFLLTRAFSLCAQLDRHIINLTEQACIELTEGEMLETAYPLREYTEETAVLIAKKKTASLFRLAAETAAYLAGLKGRELDAARLYGERLGIAFQILDDVLDVTSDESTLGKPAGIDIIERKPSMVNILWLESGDTLAVKSLMSASAVTPEEIRDILPELRAHSSIQKAKDIACSYAQGASEALTEIGTSASSAGVSDLQSLAQFTIDRLG